MIGNKIQSTYLEESNYPEAAALSFLMMAGGAGRGPGLHPDRRDRGLHGRGGGASSDGVRTATARRVLLRASPPGAGRGCGETRCTSTPGFAVAYMLVPIAVIAVFSFADDPEGPAPLRDQRRLHARVLGERLLGPGAQRGAAHLARAGGALDPGLDRDRDPDGDRAGPLPVLRPSRREPADRAADGDAGDRDRRLAALDVPDLLGPARLHDPSDRARHVLDQLRGRRGPLAVDRIRPQPRGGGRATSARPRFRPSAT